MDEHERLRRTIQNRLNEARNKNTRVITIMTSTLSEMLAVLNSLKKQEENNKSSTQT